MTTLIPTLSHPELFFGFAAPIGVDLRQSIEELKQTLNRLGYDPIEIKVTDIFIHLEPFIRPDNDYPLVPKPESNRYTSYIKYGNKLRSTFEDDAALAVLTVARLVRRRITHSRGKPNQEKFSKVAFILHQFKRKEEISLLRSIYGKQFFQISVYSRRGARVDYLAGRFANTANSANRNEFRAAAENIVQIDYNEYTDTHGQKMIKIFHDADLILNIDRDPTSIGHQIDRFCSLIFGSNSISPTKIEYGMFVAKAAALRTLDLSRQVGAAIFSQFGEIISIGSNEVPKANGGTYWCDEPHDDREYVRKVDSNDRRKNEILSELLEAVDATGRKEDEKIKESQFMDALEYGRIIHAEMSAITDAARTGRATKSAYLFCTTFPCHMCAKHIVGAGLEKVYFLEPYPKSLVTDLHSDAVCVEGNDRGQYSSYPAVVFEHFFGVSPRRYRELFEREKRKRDDGTFMEWMFGEPRPNLNITEPSYAQLENLIVSTIIRKYIEKANFNESVLDN
ncbi:hypothetical protein AMST5_03700 [freshwater sediment metagenome]|uniref:CMP/dCMP-type deaminase domain-containing protein n=1 Tax=freshwater sediment metagenome TaxID=556182 RepID=A0AA48RBS0_9ZZZZ